jgi:heme/copper-type cytochrome/quinol oxidase subunit 2
MEVVNTTTTTDPVNMYNYLNRFILNPMVFIIILLVIVTYFMFSSSLGSGSDNLGNSSDSTNKGSSIMGIIVIVILIVLIIINAFQYFFSINVTAYIQGLFTPQTTLDIVVDQSTYQPESTVPEIRFKKQVFNIPGNYYNYENAKALCKAYGANLATYDQIENAYNNGAEWCNYGWSANQLALFPTQKKTYDNLQKIPGHENDCGRAGVNGGYIANPNINFGVNCFGYKPKITEEEDELMKTATPYPETAQDIAFQKRVDYWKNKIDEILVSPFNYSTWGSF